MNLNGNVTPPKPLARHARFNISEATEQVLTQGYYIIDNYATNVPALKQESEALIQGYAGHNAKGVYPNGDTAIAQHPAELASTQPNLFALFNDPQLKQVYCNITASSNRYFDKLYITHDYRRDRGPARNGFLHFDRYWAFKCMLYLSDVEQHCGAFSVVPGSLKLGKSLRKQAWQQQNQYNDVKNRIELDYPELGLSLENASPIYGKAGTLIIFDSDILHFGGLTEPGYERLLARSHSN